MKLLVLDQFSDLGGAQQVLLELLPALRTRGCTARVGLPGEGPMFARVRDLGFEAVRIECGPYRSGRKSPLDFARFALSTPRLAAQIRTLADVDLIYVNGPRLMPAVALANTKVPVLFHSHSFLPPGRVRRLIGKAIRRTRAWVVANCDFVARSWREFAGDQVSIIFNGVSGPAEPRRLAAPYPRVGCIGRISPEKGQREFVQAAVQIHHTLPECRFVVFGSPILAESRYAEEVRHTAKDLPVEFAGWTEDIYGALESLDLLLVPSAPHEATTRAILEAFAAAVPVIAFRSGGIPEVIADGRNGYLVDGVDEVARLAIGLLSGPRERLAAIAAAGRETWASRFTLDRFHAGMFSVLESTASLSRN